MELASERFDFQTVDGKFECLVSLATKKPKRINVACGTFAIYIFRSASVGHCTAVP